MPMDQYTANMNGTTSRDRNERDTATLNAAFVTSLAAHYAYAKTAVPEVRSGSR
jgi:hypothetical protein